MKLNKGSLLVESLIAIMLCVIIIGLIKEIVHLDLIRKEIEIKYEKGF